MAKRKAKEPKDNFKELALDIAGSLDKEFKATELKSAYFLADDDVSSVTDFVPTGLDMLDLAIANKPNGGWPVGRISEITGLEASGKSLLAAYALKNTQEKGGVAVLIDTEAAVSRAYLEAIGVDTTKLLYVPLEAIEDVFTTIDIIIEKVRTKDKDRLVTIVVDSVMGATTKVEQAAEHGKDGYATAKSIIISKAMRKITNKISRQKICLIFTNQLRVRMGVMFGDKYSTSGGKAIGFHASVRVRLQAKGKIKKTSNGIVNTVGVKTSCKVSKNRLGPPLKTVEYDIYYSHGIDNYGSWLTLLREYKIVTGTKAKTTYKLSTPLTIVDQNAEEIKDQTAISFQSKDFAGYLERNPKLKKQIYDIVCEKYIMKYEINKDYGIDDIVIDTDDVAAEA